ncbi:unnamed protein product [Adineta steineri]|uniref:UV-stimulated scaffold protein A C-terminal domain-containing protein n=3 Tax=Adineta steineri TaxID=433720 RepID=A0A815JAA2_9BILA|nr:unnamed protein product [Adineta steineri]CAF1376761.1 unnamed protein product [Adineta steineri]CAF1378704.1 unnamed protein product [Adineta steineri]
MNQLVEQSLSNLVQELTISGSRTLNEEKIKQLKQICKQTDVNVEYCYRLLIAQLNKNHSEIRYSTFQIIDQLFNRSHHFRTLLLDDFNYLIDKCLGLNVDNQLPPPNQTARLLRQFTATSIKKWHEKFGTAYKLLDIGFNYLKNCKLMNFDNMEEPIGITAELERERNQANQIRLTQKLQTASRELNETSSEIYSCIKQAENCLNLLVSNKTESSSAITTTESDEEIVDDDDDDDDDEDDDDDFIDVPIEPVKIKNDEELLQVLGLGTAGKLNITIDLNERPKSSLFNIEMTDDNRALIENLHDLYRQLDDVYLNKIQSWMNIFIQVQQNSNEQQTSTVIKRAIDLKNSIQSCLKMIENYRLAPKRTVVTQKPGKISQVKTVTQSPPQEETTLPTLTDNEIQYFFHDDTQVLKRTFKQNDIENPFVRPTESNEMPESLQYSLLMHKRTYVSELPAIKWKCRAPLDNNKLCERMDRYKCPFHGRIIARDEQGQAADEKIRKHEEEQQLARKRSRPEWQDPEMLEDIRLATGVDLRMSEANKRKKKKKKIESGLTELGIEENTVRKRLEKKLLNRASVKRIGAALEADERRRNEEKFHHQFNYSLNN